MAMHHQLLECHVEGCTRNDLRGQRGVAIHMVRAHDGRNWSTRPKPDKGTPLPRPGSIKTE